MIREDFMTLEVLKENLNHLMNRIRKDVIGCGKYVKSFDKYCGHRYNWKRTKEFKMEVWLCDKCIKKESLENELKR